MQKLETIIDWSKPDHRDKLLDYLSNLPEEGIFWVEIKKYKKARSRDANAYYWGVVVKIVADELGYTPEEMHEILKQKFNSKRQIVTNKYFRVDDLEILMEPMVERWVDLVEPEDVKKDKEGNYLIPHAFVKNVPNFDRYGEMVDIEEEFVVPMTTTASDTYEFSQYIEKIINWAAMDLNVLIPSSEGN